MLPPGTPAGGRYRALSSSSTRDLVDNSEAINLSPNLAVKPVSFSLLKILSVCSQAVIFPPHPAVDDELTSFYEHRR